MSGRKRKADDDIEDERMSQSPSSSPALSARPPPRSMQKRFRSNISGRALPLPRLLETLSPDEMRNLLQSICQRHPDIGNEVVTTAPRPSIQSTLEVLSKYESEFQAAFPFGGSSSSDYAYNRVRQQLTELLEAMKDFTPHFLPPNEQQAATSLAFLALVAGLLWLWLTPSSTGWELGAVELGNAVLLGVAAVAAETRRGSALSRRLPAFAVSGD